MDKTHSLPPSTSTQPQDPPTRPAGTYSRIANNGGSQGGTIRFKEELAHEANPGLSEAVAKLENKVKSKHKDISYADLYTLAGAVAVETMWVAALCMCAWLAVQEDLVSRASL